MTEFHVAFDGTGYRVFGTTDGIDRTWRGPRWATPRQAIAYSDLQASAVHVSPLRQSGEPSSASSVVPLSGGGLLDGSPDVREPSGQSGG